VVNPSQPEGAFPDARPGSEQSPGAGPSWVDDIDRFVADRRGDDAVVERRRSHWVRQQLDEATTLASALDAAAGLPVTLVLADGERLAVVVDEVGADHVSVRAQSSSVWVALDAVVALESDTTFVEDPETLATPTALLGDVLADLVERCAIVAVSLVGGTTVRGEATGVGATFSLRASDPARHVRIDPVAIVRVTLLEG
jgi:hypothetical protein